MVAGGIVTPSPPKKRVVYQLPNVNGWCPLPPYTTLGDTSAYIAIGVLTSFSGLPLPTHAESAKTGQDKAAAGDAANAESPTKKAAAAGEPQSLKQKKPAKKDSATAEKDASANAMPDAKQTGVSAEDPSKVSLEDPSAEDAAQDGIKIGSLNVKGYIGARVDTQNDREGGRKRQTFGAPAVDITISERVFFGLTDALALDLAADNKPQVGVYLVNNDTFKFAIAATYESDFNKRAEPSTFGANSLSAADLRAFASYTVDNTQFAARYSRVVAGSESEKLSFGAIHLFELQSDLFLAVGGSSTWINQKGANALFDPIITADDGAGGTITGRLRTDRGLGRDRQTPYCRHQECRRGR